MYIKITDVMGERFGASRSLSFAFLVTRALESTADNKCGKAAAAGGGCLRIGR